MSNRPDRFLVLITVLVLTLLSVPSGSAPGSDRHRATWSRPTFASAIVVDAETGEVLYEKRPHLERAPASLVKMMLELVAFEAIDRGEITWDDKVTVPREATRVRGSRVGLWAGEVVTVRDLLAATTIASANDAATALGLHIAGSTEACVSRMNQRACELGMNDTHYVNTHGLDTGGRPGSVTTAWDQAILARKLIEIPEALRLSGTISASIRGGQTIRTTNQLLTRFPGIDGLKTGTTGRAGCCLVSTAERMGWRLVGVVLGAANTRRRFEESANLLYESFLNWQKVRVLSEGDYLGENLPVRDGEFKSVRLLSGCDIDILIPTWRRQEIQIAVSGPPSTRAPVAQGWTLGRVQVLLGDSIAAECPAVSARAISRASGFESFSRPDSQ